MCELLIDFETFVGVSARACVRVCDITYSTNIHSFMVDLRIFDFNFTSCLTALRPYDTQTSSYINGKGGLTFRRAHGLFAVCDCVFLCTLATVCVRVSKNICMYACEHK